MNYTEFCLVLADLKRGKPIAGPKNLPPFTQCAISVAFILQHWKMLNEHLFPRNPRIETSLPTKP